MYQHEAIAVTWSVNYPQFSIYAYNSKIGVVHVYEDKSSAINWHQQPISSLAKEILELISWLAHDELIDDSLNLEW